MQNRFDKVPANYMYNILVLDGGTQGLIIVKSLRKLGNRVVMIYHGKHSYADDSKYVSKKYFCNLKDDTVLFYDFVVDVVRKEKIDAVIPMSDMASKFLSKNKGALSQYVRFQVPDYNVFENGYDKNKLMSLCKAKNYPHPFTINSLENIEKVGKEKCVFPLLIKPNHTCGGRGMTLVHSYEELLEKYPIIYAQYGDCHLQKYIKQGGAQVEVQLYVNEKQELVCSSVIYKYRWYPENGGSSCCAVTVENKEVVEICYNLLKDLGWVGFADFDLIEDPEEGDLKIMELNPRVPACVKAAIVSGIDWGRIILDEYMGNPQQKYEYRYGKFLRHIGFEMLWFFYSSKRFNTYPSWFRFWGKNLYFQDLDIKDPLPFIWGTMHNIKKQLSPSFRKSKDGTRV